MFSEEKSEDAETGYWVILAKTKRNGENYVRENGSHRSIQNAPGRLIFNRVFPLIKPNGDMC